MSKLRYQLIKFHKENLFSKIETSIKPVSQMRTYVLYWFGSVKYNQDYFFYPTKKQTNEYNFSSYLWLMLIHWYWYWYT